MGAFLGLCVAAGVLIVVARVPFRRRLALVDRLAPYVTDVVPPSALLATKDSSQLSGAVGNLVRPIVTELARRVDVALGRNAKIRRHLEVVGSPLSIEQFRQEQILWASCGAAGGLLLLIVRLSTSVGSPLLSYVGIVVLATFAGFFARETLLARAVRAHDEQIALELPAVAELLALAVGAGESPVAALERVTRRRRGALATELATAVADARSGTPFGQALSRMAERSSLPALVRFVDGMSVALQRGTPLADVLRAQALDAREAGRRNLLEAGGKKEIAMMVPVVFLVLPVTILFALYPGAVTLTSIAQ
jgi:tight adherence protein C